MLLTIFQLMGAMMLALVGTGVTYQHFSTKLDAENYQPIGKLVDIGGYKLHMLDQGCGGPTVVIDSGVRCNCLDWWLVQPDIAKFTRVITYDRAGYGWSDESPLDRTSKNIVKELRAMLKQAGVPGPYILVGHSFGGNNMQLFAMMYPHDVAGLILVDSVHPDLLSYVNLPSIEYFHLSLCAVYLGVFRVLVNVPFVRDIVAKQLEKFPIDIQKIYYSRTITAKFVHAVSSEAVCASESLNQVSMYGNSLGSLPLTVVTASNPLMDYENVKNIYNSREVDVINQGWLNLQHDLTNKSSNVKHIIAQDSGHMIPVDRPDVIIAAVQNMVDQLNHVRR